MTRSRARAITALRVGPGRRAAGAARLDLTASQALRHATPAARLPDPTRHPREWTTRPSREAFLWFGIDQPREVRAALETFWAREDRFQAQTEVELRREDGRRTRRVTLYPLPHPSPLNQTWYKRFPALLDARLRQLAV
ncbi:hypothetical protein ACM9W9_19315 [Xanthomonas sacchari]